MFIAFYYTLMQFTFYTNSLQHFQGFGLYTGHICTCMYMLRPVMSCIYIIIINYIYNII